MLDILRESIVGQWLHWASDGRILPYPDQTPDFIIPSQYLLNGSFDSRASSAANEIPSSKPSTFVHGDDEISEHGAVTETKPEPDVEAGVTAHGHHATADNPVMKDIEKHGYVLVDWYGPNDPENPKNWSAGKKYFVLFEICLLTISVYIGAAIYTAGIPYIETKFGVSTVAATLGLSLFIEGYATGPMIFSPLQEIPSIGRNPAYIYTLVIFALLNIGASLSPNFGALLVFRFLTGFFGSPALATGGATISDVFPPAQIPYVIGLWAVSAFCGPVLGPIVGGFAAAAEGWNWPLWELTWASGLAAIFLAILLPETLAGTVLLKRARRLRKLTGNEKLRSYSEVEQSEMTAGQVAKEYLVRPFQLLTEPAILFIDIYVGLIYAIFYLWFESFPLVFIEIYGFQGGISGLPFLGIFVGSVVAYTFYVGYNYYYLIPKFSRKHWQVAPEEWLTLACFAGFFIPVSLLLFGWSARPSVHWIVPIIGAALYVPGIFLLFQSAIVYLPISYPKYVASVFAGNGLIFAKAFFDRLGMGGGNSLLAGLSILMIPGTWALCFYGSRLRAMSKYASH